MFAWPAPEWTVIFRPVPVERLTADSIETSIVGLKGSDAQLAVW